MRNTKEKILDQILLLQTATITQLADRLNISEISVRHHLLKLEAEGIVTSSEERHGVGRPRFIYRLTEKGFQNAPVNHIKLTDLPLTTMERVLGADALAELFKQIGADLAEDYWNSLTFHSPEEALTALTKRLTEDGFIVSWSKDGENLVLTTNHCPFHYLGQKHPAVCTISRALLESLLQRAISLEPGVLSGEAACIYIQEVDNGK